MTGLASPRQECPHQRRTWLPWSAEFRAVLRGTQLPVSPPVMIASTGGPAVPDSATSQPLGFEAYLVCRETNGLRNACGGGFRRAPGTVERSVQTVQCMDESRDSDRMESSSSVTISQRLATGMQPSSRTPEGDDNTCPVCGGHVRIEPSRPPGDAPCPHCGTLLWFAAGAIRSLDAKEAVIPPSSKGPWRVVSVQSSGPWCVVTVQSSGARRG